MSVKINDVEYKGIAGLLIGLPIAIITMLFTALIMIIVGIFLASPLILIGFIVWLIAH